jgi:tight adherence protein B
VSPILIALLSFGTVTAVLLAVAMLVRDLRRPDETLDRRLGLNLGPEPSGSASFPPEKERSSWLDRHFYRLLEQCGTRLDAASALALVAGLAIVGCALPLVFLESIPGAILGTLLGAVLPLLWWEVRRALRYRAMQKGLPETLELMSDGIRAGQTLELAADMVAKEAPRPLAEEFGYCVAQLRLGHSPVAVLSRMARRVPLPEFKIFTTAVLVHRQTGGNLALLAQRLAQSARDRSEFQGHVRAVTAGSRLSVLGLTFGTLLALGALASLRPEYLLAYRDHPMAPVLLGTAAALQLVGILWVWRILRVSF